MPAFEKPQTGNPHQLTVNQHCFPSSCIERFCNHSGTVEVKLKSSKTSFGALPSNKVFCAKRAWDQRAESGYMLSIENEYRDFANQIIGSDLNVVAAKDNSIVSAMYCLWSLRESMRDAEIDEGPIPGVVGLSVEYSKDDMEFLEKNHIGSIRPDFSFPARHITGALIQLRLNRCLRDLKGTKWHLIYSSDVEFAVPDSSLNRMILPLTPSLCFYHEYERTTLDGVTDVRAFNRISVQESSRYSFARDFSKT